MSTIAEILERAGTLLDRIRALIDSARAIDLPGVAAELGVAGTAADLSAQLAEVLQRVHDELRVVTALGQLGALLGLLDPLVAGLRGLFTDGGRLVTELGLSVALEVTDAIATDFQRLEDVVALGSTQAVVVDRAEALREAVLGVVGALLGLESDFRAAHETHEAA